MTKLILIAAIIIAVFIIVSNLGNGLNFTEIFANAGSEKSDLSSKRCDKNPKFKFRKPTDNETSIFARWSVCQLDSSGRIISKPQEVVLKDKGNGIKAFSIGSSNSDDFIIKSSEFVSKTHLIISEDSNGFYAKDNGSLNSSYIKGVPVTNAFDLEHQLVVYLADTPICFFKNSLKQDIIKPADITVDDNLTFSVEKNDNNNKNENGPFRVSVNR